MELYYQQAVRSRNANGVSLTTSSTRDVFAEKFKTKDTMSVVENRESGEKYLKEHNIDDALRLMRENLIKVQPENPWSFMIDSTFFFVRTTFLRV